MNSPKENEMNRALQLLVNRQGLCDKSIRLRLREVSQEFKSNFHVYMDHDQHVCRSGLNMLSSGDVELCEQFFDRAIYDNSQGGICCICGYGNTYKVAQKGDIEMLQFLYRKIDPVYHFSSQTLMNAAFGKSIEMVSWLLRNGNYTADEVEKVAGGASLVVRKWLYSLGVHVTIEHFLYPIIRMQKATIRWCISKIELSELVLYEIWQRALISDFTNCEMTRVLYLHEDLHMEFSEQVSEQVAGFMVGLCRFWEDGMMIIRQRKFVCIQLDYFIDNGVQFTEAQMMRVTRFLQANQEIHETIETHENPETQEPPEIIDYRDP